MAAKIGIVGFAQSRHQENMQKTREDMVFDVCKEALRHAGILREELDTVVTASTDYLDGRTISNVFLSMAVGAYLKDESKVEEDGSFALIYAMMKILSGSAEVGLVEAHTQGSVFNPHQVSFYTLDPLFDRQVGVMNDVAAAAIQARIYMEQADCDEEDMAGVAMKNLANGSLNPNAHRRMAGVSIDEILESRPYYDPIVELTKSPISDGACAVIIANEKRAREICDNPVWIEGVGLNADAYIRDRDLGALTSLGKAAEKAYGQAGVTDPISELDFAEVTERYAHEEMMIYEELGLCERGRGKSLVRSGVTWADGEFPVNPSGGALSADPVCATGLIRIIEAARQIRGEAGPLQVEGARRGIAHGQFGMCAQKNAVFVLGGES